MKKWCKLHNSHHCVTRPVMESHATCAGCDELPKLAALSSAKVDGFERRVIILICKQEVLRLDVPPHHAMLVKLRSAQEALCR
jgi:hypothetical protein